MSDLIRREDAIEAIEGTDWYHINERGEMVHGANDDLHQAWQKADEIHKAIESIPSAERKGEWEIIGRNIFHRICPFCKRPRALRDSRFCDWCGARMKGADDE